jgi:murein DD-endopeptidase MepM/ murein hydrolase activator NlpD
MERGSSEGAREVVPDRTDAQFGEEGSMARHAYPFVRETNYPHEHWDGALAVDVFGPSGSSVVACTDGMAEVHDYPRGGHTVTLHGDDGRQYYYAHLVAGSGVGGRVSAGQRIGQMDNTGNADVRPTHCHWAASSAGYGIDDNGAGDIAPWTLLDQWRAQGLFVAGDEEDMTRIGELTAEVARLKEELARELGWGSGMIVHVIKPGFSLLEEALAAGELDRAKVEQVRDLLRENGGAD